MHTKIYLLDAMSNTPFSFDFGIEYLKKKGIEITNDEKDADIYVTRFFPIKDKKDLLLWRLKHRYIPLLVWTDEPRFNTMRQTHFPAKIYVPEISIMNCYSGDIYTNPWGIFGYWTITKKLEYADAETIKTHAKKICSMGSYRHEPLIFDGKDIDLTDFRQKLSIEGYKKGLVDICGPNWPEEVKITKEDRKTKDWHQSKLDFLKDYRFNIAIENTNIKYYITEKIWDPISAQVLPIYYGNEWIYEIFPKRSFIDTNDFKSNSELLEYTNSISDDEYITRMNLCIDVYNKAYKEIDFESEFNKVIDKAIERIKTMVKK